MNSPVATPPAWPLVCIMGPTAVGKTRMAMALADRLAEAGIGADLVSADAVQVYRGMDIGSAKPDAAILRDYPHALIDIRSPLETYDAWQFCRDALDCLENSRRRGRIPVLAGGTMFYFSALLHGLDDLPSADPGLRARLEQDAGALGRPALHRRLAAADPEAAGRISPRDTLRVIRALEIAMHGSGAGSVSRTTRLPGDWRPLKLVLYEPDRRRLHRRIAERTRLMLEHGLLDEVDRLIDTWEMHDAPPAMRAVGYRQALEVLQNQAPATNLYASIVAATRQLAKRQLTWLRNEPGAIWLDCNWAAKTGFVAYICKQNPAFSGLIKETGDSTR